MSAVVIVLCTAPAQNAQALADRLLAERLVACVNLLGPMRSRYWWEERIEEAEEVLLLCKTRRDLAAALRDRIVALHPYQIPEVLEVAVDGGLPAYLAWVQASCRG
jgi:periplasmic divalent cation tolerance protein